jgi:hypothetical protein
MPVRITEIVPKNLLSEHQAKALWDAFLPFLVLGHGGIQCKKTGKTGVFFMEKPEKKRSGASRDASEV